MIAPLGAAGKRNVRDRYRTAVEASTLAYWTKPLLTLWLRSLASAEYSMVKRTSRRFVEVKGLVMGRVVGVRQGSR